MKDVSGAGSTDRAGQAAEMRQARRRFLLRCGRFAAVTPPIVTLLLSASASRYAVAQSGGQSSGGSSGDSDDSFLGILRRPGAREPGDVGPATGIRG